MILLDPFARIVSQPFDYVRAWKKETGKSVIGHFCSYTPEELICAADALPFRIFGSSDNLPLADSHLQPYSCAFAKDLQRALAIEITDKDLQTGVETVNRIRNRFRRLYEIRSGDPEKLSSADLLHILKGSMMINRPALIGHLDELLLVLDNAEEDLSPKEGRTKNAL
jgi:benzoyl-CoA reductase/2-hydroxyglutaryl-CoA dehydratase subunit BcrC/BadD/HgdB